MTAQTQPLVGITDVVKHFDISGGFLDRLTFSGGLPSLTSTTVKAINGVSLDIRQGEILSVVGESGCGKSTLGRTVLGLYPPTSGRIEFRGERIDNLSAKDMLPYRRKMQMVFQDPYASLNPRMTVRQILEEPTRFHFPDLSASQVQDKVAEVMRQVGVDPAWAGRFPHEFSGGQRQRISIARALMVDPEFIVADEPISALDVSIQAQILNLIMDCQERFGLTYMFITHDLSVVEHISTRVAVMYLGTLCELADKASLYGDPQHPYSRALLSAIPRLGAKGVSHIRLKGEVPTPINLPTGCVFHTRCPYTDDRCRREIPALRKLPNGSQAACHALEEGRI
ncbi:ABC transporter ATP-binding protein [Desulfomicrobium escambiense]|uniref:ABC transporter ATP-binding protein n=1 Tax=Desulfomicrobium escambiense TaxID=29503 RepID=UPI00040D5DDD|nr:oligopeptide/dipeptide ABC transporter ATP-binding protein [Desulfomicrobium escambiense]